MSLASCSMDLLFSAALVRRRRIEPLSRLRNVMLAIAPPS